jgi:hypothetical protein
VQSSTPASASSRWRTILAFAAFALALYGLKLWVIAAFGNATPFWDQWDAELDALFLPFRHGTLRIGSFFVPHNEHRIVATRLIALLLLEVNGAWNPLFEMIVNAAVHVTALVLTVAFTSRALSGRYLIPLLVFAFAVVSLPFGWENALQGFQGAFYWLLLFSIAALWLLVTSAALTRRWWCGIACAVLAYLSLASGILADAAAATVAIVAYLLNRDRSRHQVIGTAILIILFVMGYALTPDVPGNVVFKAASFAQFTSALNETLSWPLPTGLLSLLVRNGPLIVWAWMVCRERPASSEPAWFVVALGIWMTAQAVIVSYGRASTVLSSRYLDITSIGLIVNFAALLLIAERSSRRSASTAPRLSVAAALAVWIVVTVVALASAATIGVEHQPFPGGLQEQLALRKSFSTGQEQNTRNFLLTGDIDHLKNKGFLMVPYPGPERLAGWLSAPDVQAMLPTNLQIPLKPLSVDCDPDTFKTDGYSPYTRRRTDSVIGSYTATREAATGQATVQFAGYPTSRTIAIPVAGYPLKNGIELSIEQKGTLRVLQAQTDPGDSWAYTYATVSAGPFSIHIRDASSKTWIAIAGPVAAGRLDPAIDSLLSPGSFVSYQGFLVAALTLTLLIAVLAG